MDLFNIKSKKLDSAVDYFKQNGFCFLPSFLNINDCNTILASFENLDERRVICKTGEIEFGEQEIPDNHKIVKDFFLNKYLLEFLNNCFETDKNFRKVIYWNSIYKENEYINKHKDIAGDVQVLICLLNDGDIGNGALHIEKEDKKYNFDLKIGDLIIFKASELYHYTSPLKSIIKKNPKRVVSVGRYYY